MVEPFLRTGKVEGEAEVGAQDQSFSGGCVTFATSVRHQVARMNEAMQRVQTAGVQQWRLFRRSARCPRIT